MKSSDFLTQNSLGQKQASSVASAVSARVDFQKHTTVLSFVQAYVQEQKALNKKFRLSDFCEAMSVSPSTLTKILNGDRGIGAEFLEKLIQYFQFDLHDAAAFRNLALSRKPGIFLNTSPDAIFHETLRLEHQKYQVISGWHHFAIIELTRLSDFKESAEWIRTQLRFQLPLKEIERSLRLSEELGLLARDKKGRLYATANAVFTSNDISREAVRVCHLQHLENTKTALQTIDVSEREFQTAVFFVEPDQMHDLKTEIRNFQSHLMKKFESLKPSQKAELLQLNQHVFSMTERNKKESSKKPNLRRK